MALVKGIHHVCLRCEGQADYEKTVNFYKEILGLTLLREWPGGCMLDTGCGIVEIFKNGTDHPSQGPLRHLAFLVESADACVKAVQAAGYEVYDGPRDAVIPAGEGYPIRVAFFRGPQGEDIELFQER